MNQLTQVGGAITAHDARGNMTNDGTRSYAYTSENRLATSGSVTYAYDPLGRMHWREGADVLQYDGDSLIAELSLSGFIVQRRYVHGPGLNETGLHYYRARTAVQAGSGKC